MESANGKGKPISDVTSLAPSPQRQVKRLLSALLFTLLHSPRQFLLPHPPLDERRFRNLALFPVLLCSITTTAAPLRRKPHLSNKFFKSFVSKKSL